MPTQTGAQAQSLCQSCGVVVPSELMLCESCERLLPLPDRVSYFEFMELPLKLDIDLAALEKTFYRLSRLFHPDFYQNRPNSEQRAALERSATLNKAYTTLKDPTRRAEYLMKLRGFEQSTEKNRVPQDLMVEILELQEQLEEFQSSEGGERERLAQALRAGVCELKERRAELGKRLEELFPIHDRAGEDRRAEILLEMRETIDRSNYLFRIVENIEKTLESGR